MGKPPDDVDEDNYHGVMPNVDDDPDHVENQDHFDRELEHVRTKRGSETDCQTNDSCFASIANNEKFQHTTLLVIVINALWIGVDTEWNHKILKDPVTDESRLNPAANVVENIFCCYFTFEVVCRFMAFKRTCMCFRDAWFVFDSLLVTCMVLETWVIAIVALATGAEGGGASFMKNFSALRLLRLLRLTRMARLMRSVPELMTLVKGMISATKSVFFILLFLILVMYVWAIIMTSIVGDNENTDPEPDTCEHMFGTIGDSLMSLFTNGVLGDNLSAAVQAILDYPNGEGSGTGLFLMWLFFVFFAISSMTLLNMLIGVLCEVITGTATTENENNVISGIRCCIEDAFYLIDTNQDGRICEAEWGQIKNNTQVRAQLSALGVDNEHMDERLDQIGTSLFQKHQSAFTKDDIDKTPVGYDLDDLINKVVDIRPDKPASALDLELLRAKVTVRDKQFATRLGNVEQLIGKMLERKHGGPLGSIYVPGMSQSPSPLKEMPTEVLFHGIKSRAQKVGLGPEKSSNQPIFNQGAISISALKNFCSEQQ